MQRRNCNLLLFQDHLSSQSLSPPLCPTTALCKCLNYYAIVFYQVSFDSLNILCLSVSSNLSKFWSCCRLGEGRARQVTLNFLSSPSFLQHVDVRRQFGLAPLSLSLQFSEDETQRGGWIFSRSVHQVSRGAGHGRGKGLSVS